MNSKMEIKEKFELKLRSMIDTKGKSTRLFTRQKLQDIIWSLSKDPESDGVLGTADYYNYRTRYEILKVGEAERLIRKRKDGETDYKYVTAFEEAVGAVEKAHKDVGHGGEKKTLFEVKKKMVTHNHGVL